MNFCLNASSTGACFNLPKVSFSTDFILNEINRSNCQYFSNPNVWKSSDRTMILSTSSVGVGSFLTPQLSKKYLELSTKSMQSNISTIEFFSSLKYTSIGLFLTESFTGINSILDKASYSFLEISKFK